MRIPKRSIGYCCCPDIADARTLLEYAKLAETAGFSTIWVSDHFHPWSHTRAYEANAWVWMSVALCVTQKVAIGTAVTAPILRYHPAIVAQAFATMESIFGPRVVLGIGIGEALNEVPLGLTWPNPKERRERLVEAIKVIRLLWSGEYVNFQGKFYALRNACLYMKASVPICVASFGPKSAYIAGKLGDGLITTIKPLEYIKSTLFPALSKGAKESGRSVDDLVKVIELDVSYDEDYDKALSTLRFWAPTLLEEAFVKAISDPRELEEMGKTVSDKRLEEAFVVFTTPDELIKRIEDAFKAGFDHVYIQSTSPDELKFIKVCREKVLPYFKES
jgi:coenzyme F420-dependent glucose-6-phosphate dehydrogenase